MAHPTEEANAKAVTLFQSLLTPEELEEWKFHGYVTLTGSEGGVYRIHTRGGSYVDNVHRLNPDTMQAFSSLCAAPNMWPTGRGFGVPHIPIPDAWVGQLLALRYNEREFLATAFESRLYYR